MKFVSKVVFLSCVREEYQKKSGGTGVMYRISIDQDGVCGSLACTEDVYNQLHNQDRFTEIKAVGEYNPQYRSFRIVGVA